MRVWTVIEKKIPLYRVLATLQTFGSSSRERSSQTSW